MDPLDVAIADFLADLHDPRAASVHRGPSGAMVAWDAGDTRLMVEFDAAGTRLTGGGSA